MDTKLLVVLCSIVFYYLVIPAASVCDTNNQCKKNEPFNLTVMLYNYTTGDYIEGATINLTVYNYLYEPVIQGNMNYLSNGLYYYELNLDTEGIYYYIAKPVGYSFVKPVFGEFEIVSELVTLSTIWSYFNRTLTSPPLTAYDIWSYSDRSLTTVSNIAESVWSYFNRTLTSAPLTAYDVWTYSNRSLTFTSNIAEAVWLYSNRSLTFTSNIAEAVWLYSNRSLTFTSNIAEAVWNYTNRTLTEASNIAQSVWTYINRSLTTPVDITRTSVESTAVTVWNSTVVENRTVTETPDCKEKVIVDCSSGICRLRTAC